VLISGDSFGRILQWEIPPEKLCSYVQAEIGSYVFPGAVKELRTLPGGDGLAVASMRRGMTLWRAADELQLARGHTLAPGQIVIDADISPDGRTVGLVIARQDGGELQLVDAATGRVSTQLIGYKGRPLCLRFSPDGKTIACGSSNKELVLYDFATRQAWPWGVLEVGAAPGRLAFSSDGRRLASGDALGRVTVWRLVQDSDKPPRIQTSERIFQAPSVIHCVAFSPDGNRLAAGYAETQVWDVPSGNKLLELPGQEVSFSPDGSLIVTGGGSLGADAAIWDAATGEQRVKLSGSHAADLTCVLYANAARVVTGDIHGQLRCWDAQTGQPIKPFAGL
jgi:WD40 repeat protein